MVKMYRSVKIF